MYVYACVCLHVCVIHAHLYMCTCVYMCIIYICVYVTHVYMCFHECMYVCLYCVHVSVCVYVYMYVHLICLYVRVYMFVCFFFSPLSLKRSRSNDKPKVNEDLQYPDYVLEILFRNKKTPELLGEMTYSWLKARNI